MITTVPPSSCSSIIRMVRAVFLNIMNLKLSSGIPESHQTQIMDKYYLWVSWWVETVNPWLSRLLGWMVRLKYTVMVQNTNRFVLWSEENWVCTWVSWLEGKMFCCRHTIGLIYIHEKLGPESPDNNLWIIKVGLWWYV